MIKRGCYDRATVVFLFWALCRLCGSAQSWQQEQELDLGVHDSTAHVSMALEGDVLVVSIATASTGHVEVRARDQGGENQWEMLSSFDSNEPWFGYSLALRNGKLVVGSPGANDYSGIAHLYRVDPISVLQPLTPLGVVQTAEPLPGDRFGYALSWLGDTLAISAVERPGFRTRGAVFLFDNTNDMAPMGQLPNDPDRSQIPFQRWFGASMARKDDQLVVSAPFSGFRNGNEGEREQIGTLHLYHRSNQDPSGWALDTVLFDLSTIGTNCPVFERVELGRGGMAFVDGDLAFDHSDFYTGLPTSSMLEDWSGHGPGSSGCSKCRTRIAAISPPDATLETATTTSQPSAYRRSYPGWCALGTRLVSNWFDSAGPDPVWLTAIHARDQGGPGAWGIEEIIPELYVCDEFTGPVVGGPGMLVRTSLQRSGICGLTNGTLRLLVQLFRHS